MNSDLLDCLQKYQIGPMIALPSYFDAAVELATGYGFADPSVMRRVFKGLGKCEDLILDPNKLHSLDEYHTVQYKLNPNGECGPQFEGSYNYSVGEYRRKLLSGSSEAMNFVNSRKIIDKLQKGLSESPVIVSIMDTSINKGLILDGTRRLFGLIYIKCMEPHIYENLDFSNYPIKFCKLTSPVARIIFQLDFWKLT
jgi:hypothetical protein